ncbi:Transcription antiterminator LicT [Sarcina ventriculi]|uniref:BglG family transcription antiterminator LicT n=1 Tax=Sarcina ventriculi TaxID=1267 RepID=UPI000D9F9E86|nr:PRD domain-containing protein [Sarcina ventriculi]SPZ50009.1 Transcription antiterminator LicT [Sarcina ventriculi]
MIIKKIFNNNVVLAKEKNKDEIIAMGCGIAFKKRSGDILDKDLIEKTFILKENNASDRFKSLLENVPIEQIKACSNIIEYVKANLNVKLNDYIYVTLTDHINHSINLYDEGISKPNILGWEVKKFYNKEYKVGLKALDIIEEYTKKRLPNDEASNIALHIINAQINCSSKESLDAIKIAKYIQGIMTIIRYTYNIEIDENSLNYDRFITHLRFLLKRLNDNNMIESDNDLLEQVKEKYKKAYNCMLKIEKFLEVDMSNDEKLYLTIHIQRVTQR